MHDAAVTSGVHVSAWVLVALASACEPTLLIVERPELPAGALAVAFVAVGASDTGDTVAVLRRADDVDAVRLGARLDAEVHVYAYDRGAWASALPDGGVPLLVTPACAPHALPAAAWRWSIRGTTTSTDPPELSLSAPSIACAPSDPALSAVPGDGRGETCRAVSLVRGDCELRVAESPTVCPPRAAGTLPGWGLRVDGSLCGAPLPGACVADTERDPSLVVGAVCGEDRLGVVVSTPLVAQVETVTVAAPVPFDDDDGDHSAESGDAMETGVVVDFVEVAGGWLVLGDDEASSPAGCRHRGGTPLYLVDRETLAVTQLPRQPRGCLRAPLALPGGGFLAGFRRTDTSSDAASLWIARLDARGEVVVEAPIPASDALAPRALPEDGQDERLIAALVDITPAGAAPRVLAVVRGYCPLERHFCTVFHVFDPLTLATLDTSARGTRTSARGAQRDGDELVVAYDSPDRLEIRPLPLDLDGPTAWLDAMPRSGASTDSHADRSRRLWLQGSVHDRGLYGGLRVHTERPPSQVSSLALLGASPLASPFGLGVTAGRVFAFFTLPGRVRSTWMAEIPAAERPIPPVLARSYALGHGVVGRVRSDAQGRLWALVPERGVLLRITVP